MTMKHGQILRASFVVALGTVQITPCLLLLCDSLASFAIGIVYSVCLAYFWNSTIIGRRFFRAFYRSTLRLENLMRPTLGER